MAKVSTPLLDELEKGPWPSFVKEIKKRADKSSLLAHDLLGSWSSPTRRRSATGSTAASSASWAMAAASSAATRDLPEEFPERRRFHTFRVNQPAGWFYTTDTLRTLCDVWDKHGSGLTNMHGATGDIILLGAQTESSSRSSTT